MSKKKRKSTLGDHEETIVYALAGESDRGCVLVSTEFLSDALEAYLRTKFSKVGTPKGIQERLLTAQMAPLSSFAMRINICRAIGLIGTKTFHALDDLREIRNRAAHHTAFNLQDKEIEQQIRTLSDFSLATSNGQEDSVLTEKWKSVGEDFAAISSERATILNGTFSLYGWIWSREMYLSQGVDYLIE